MTNPIMANGAKPALNIAVARVIPLLLLALIGYSAFVITKVVAIDYLLTRSRHNDYESRPRSAAAVIAIYYILLIPLLVSYGRVVQTIITTPGYVPYGAGFYEHQAEAIDTLKEKHDRRHRRKSATRADLAEKPVRTAPSDPPFWQRDIFVCDADGRPPFCSTCFNYKPDRAHHCSEVQRCVLKMDHFCPWVGGIVSETSFKFFIQFLVYAAFLCIMILTTVAVLTSERLKREPGFLNVHYFVMLGVSGLFSLFTVGMAASSLQLACVNSSTIENLKRGVKVWFLAVHIPRPDPSMFSSNPAPNSTVSRLTSGGNASQIANANYRSILYPRPSNEDQFFVDQAKGLNPPSPPPSPPYPGDSSKQPRVFAILSTQPGENPFDLGPWNNVCEVMGYRFWDWVLPFRSSPCADHKSMVSHFPMDMGLVERLKKEAGLSSGRRESAGSREKTSRRDGHGASKDRRQAGDAHTTDHEDRSSEEVEAARSRQKRGSEKRKRRRRKTREAIDNMST